MARIARPKLANRKAGADRGSRGPPNLSKKHQRHFELFSNDHDNRIKKSIAEAFAKKTGQTLKKIIDTCKRRLKRYDEVTE